MRARLLTEEPAPLLSGAEGTHSARAAAVAAGLEESGHTAVLVRATGVPAGVLGIADLRPDAADTVAALTGTASILVTGDNPYAGMSSRVSGA
ncbi:hypothetical protein OIB37_35325 [Streptomyces sp. NBC_00820]|uniref:hypothetical protein n=1 Tax=Streptomyces sp. NBC_00820 TaxID=2975842 RepID=UPI002ED3A44E|nr:hypothetical protein OIB37_35325 [Streptomyces sp. NBC_00820]